MVPGIAAATKAFPNEAGFLERKRLGKNPALISIRSEKAIEIGKFAFSRRQYYRKVMPL
jgi:hypothetical protein